MRKRLEVATSSLSQMQFDTPSSDLHSPRDELGCQDTDSR